MEGKSASKFQGGCCFSMPSVQCCWAAPSTPGQGQSGQACHGALGAREVYGLSGTRQRTDRAVGQAVSVAAVPPSWPSGGHHRQVFLPHLLCRGGSKRGASCSAWPLSQCPRREAREKPAPLQDLEVPVPQAVPTGPTGSSLAGSAPRPISPGSKGSGGLEQRWLAGVGPTAPQVAHPSTTPLLHACKAAWPHGENGTGLVCPTARLFQHAPGPSSAPGAQTTQAKNNGFDCKVGDSDTTTEHPGLPAGQAGAPVLRASALTPHLLSGKCLITVHS